MTLPIVPISEPLEFLKNQLGEKDTALKELSKMNSILTERLAALDGDNRKLVTELEKTKDTNDALLKMKDGIRAELENRIIQLDSGCRNSIASCKLEILQKDQEIAELKRNLEVTTMMMQSTLGFVLSPDVHFALSNYSYYVKKHNTVVDQMKDTLDTAYLRVRTVVSNYSNDQGLLQKIQDIETLKRQAEANNQNEGTRAIQQSMTSQQSNLVEADNIEDAMNLYNPIVSLSDVLGLVNHD